MGAKDVSQQADDRDSTHSQSEPVENLESPADEEQATAGVSDPSRPNSTSSPRTGSSLDYSYSDASFVPHLHAVGSGKKEKLCLMLGKLLTVRRFPGPGSRKAPIYRRIARVVKRPYGPRITQNIRSCRCPALEIA